MLWSFLEYVGLTSSSAQPQDYKSSADVRSIIVGDEAQVSAPVLSPQYNRQSVQKENDPAVLEALREFYNEKDQNSTNRLLSPLYPTNNSSSSSWLSATNIGDFFTALACYCSKNSPNIEFVDPSYATSNLSEALLLPRFMRLKEKLSRANVIFCPVNLLGNHWGLWVLDKRDAQNHKVYCLDGFNSDTFNADGYAEQQLEYFQQYIEPLAKLFGFDASKSHHQPIPEQGNSDDCGAVVCYWAEQICEGQLSLDSPIEFEPKIYTDYRLNIAEMILENHPEAQKKSAKREKPDDGFDSEATEPTTKKRRIQPSRQCRPIDLT